MSSEKKRNLLLLFFNLWQVLTVPCSEERDKSFLFQNWCGISSEKDTSKDLHSWIAVLLIMSCIANYLPRICEPLSLSNLKLVLLALQSRSCSAVLFCQQAYFINIKFEGISRLVLINVCTFLSPSPRSFITWVYFSHTMIHNAIILRTGDGLILTSSSDDHLDNVQDGHKKYLKLIAKNLKKLDNKCFINLGPSIL